MVLELAVEVGVVVVVLVVVVGGGGGRDVVVLLKTLLPPNRHLSMLSTMRDSRTFWPLTTVSWS